MVRPLFYAFSLLIHDNWRIVVNLTLLYSQKTFIIRNFTL